MRRLGLTIRESGFQPDILVAIGRGGYIPARVLADYLDLMDLAGIKVEHYLKGAQKKPLARVRYPLNVAVTDRRVLVIDDVSDTGDTFRVTLDHMSQSGAAVIRTAVMHHKVVSRYRPDYFAQELTEWRWLIYPWAVMEDVSGFIERMVPRPQDTESAAIRLREEYGLQLPRQTLEDIFHFMFDAVPQRDRVSQEPVSLDRPP